MLEKISLSITILRYEHTKIFNNFNIYYFRNLIVGVESSTLFFVSSEQSLYFSDIKLLKNEIISLKLSPRVTSLNLGPSLLLILLTYYKFMIMKKKITKQAVYKHLREVGFAFFSLVLTAGSVSAQDILKPTGDLIGPEATNQGAKEALNAALKATRSKPALTLATVVVCTSCIPVAGIAVSASMCVACGILIAKTIG